MRIDREMEKIVAKKKTKSLSKSENSLKKSLFIFLSLGFSVCLTAAPLSDIRPSANISVDPRIELLAVVQLLSDYDLLTKFDFAYKRDVAEYFSSFKNHSAVKLFKEMSAYGFRYDAPPNAMIHLSAPPELKIQTPFTDYLIRRAGGADRLAQFVNALRDFALQSEFMTFFIAHGGAYYQIVYGVNITLEGFDAVGTLEAYCGWKQQSYNFILAPLFHAGGYGARIQRADGNFDAYIMIGPSAVKNDLPDFGEKKGLINLAWHEFGHSYVNPLCEEFREQINAYSWLYGLVSTWMKMQAYAEWQTCAVEHINRAITVRLSFLEFGREYGEQVVEYQKKQGFFYIGFICRKLELYEAQRDPNFSLADYFPEIINVFKELSENSVLFHSANQSYGALRTGKNKR